VKLLVTVVAFHSAAEIGPCVSSLLADPNVTVTVVDNSADLQTELACSAIAVRFPSRLTYLSPSSNLGFARACNLGLSRASEFDFIGLVNPDVVLTSPITLLAESIDWTTTSIATARLISPTHNTQPNWRPQFSLPREFAKAIIGTRAYAATSHPDSSHPELIRVPQIDGAFIVLRSYTWLALRGLDERFELYYEDVDLCRRANLAHGCAAITRPWGTHQGGTSYKRSSGTAYIAHRVSRIRFIRKWYGRQIGAWLIGLPITFLEFITRTVSNVDTESPTQRIAAIQAVLSELRHPGSVHVLQ